MKLLLDEGCWNGRETVLALGTFDGLHRGHVALIHRAHDIACHCGAHSVVFTFAHHPMTILRPEMAPPQLSTPEEKVRGVAMLQADALVMRRFDKAFAALSAEEFVDHLCSTLHPQCVVVGFNYSFGARGVGDAELLRRLGHGHGFRVEVVEPVCWQSEPVSSTRVRAALLAGHMRAVRGMLGRPYTVIGAVRVGKHLGRELGYPTANLALPQDKALPPYGVYAAWVRVDAQAYPAVLNLGVHPTAPGGAPTIEAHLLDVELDLYGRQVCIEFDTFLRPERHFADLAALRGQIARDAELARKILVR